MSESLCGHVYWYRVPGVSPSPYECRQPSGHPGGHRYHRAHQLDETPVVCGAYSPDGRFRCGLERGHNDDRENRHMHFIDAVMWEEYPGHLLGDVEFEVPGRTVADAYWPQRYDDFDANGEPRVRRKRAPENPNFPPYPDRRPTAVASRPDIYVRWRNDAMWDSGSDLYVTEPRLSRKAIAGRVFELVNRIVRLRSALAELNDSRVNAILDEDRERHEDPT